MLADSYALSFLLLNIRALEGECTSQLLALPSWATLRRKVTQQS